MKKVFSLLLCLMLVLSLSVTAFAAEGQVTYKGESRIWITPATTEWTSTDLFGAFKNVMPGDTLVEEFKITNGAIDCDYVKVYMQAIPHNDRNPLSQSVAEHETIATMEEFLSQLRMQVWNGNERIYSASPNRTAQLTEPVYLGTLRTWKSMELEVELEVPIELGNEYANRVGEVDWVFTFEAFDDPSENPKTGDYIMIAVAVMAVSAVALAVILIRKKKKK